jgi:hypothetical protein
VICCKRRQPNHQGLYRGQAMPCDHWHLLLVTITRPDIIIRTAQEESQSAVHYADSIQGGTPCIAADDGESESEAELHLPCNLLFGAPPNKEQSTWPTTWQTSWNSCITSIIMPVNIRSWPATGCRPTMTTQ